MDNVIDWEWLRTSDYNMEFTLTVGTAERIASIKTNNGDINLETVSKLPQMMQSHVDFVIIKLGCGCEWKATSESQGVNRICDEHYIRDIVDEAEIKISAEEDDSADN